MATPAEVIDLFADVHEGSSFERTRAAANAFRAFGSLSATDTRDLAVLMAERAAPQLVATAPTGPVPAPPEEDEASSDATRAGASEPEQAEFDVDESVFDDLPSLPDLDQRAAGGTVTTEAVGVTLCATAIETDVLDVDQLGDLVEPRAASRLRGRYR